MTPLIKNTNKIIENKHIFIKKIQKSLIIQGLS